MVANKKALVLYLPVLHEGYVRFLKSHPNSDIFLVGISLAEELSEKYEGEVSLRPLVRDPRSLKPADMACALQGLLGEEIGDRKIFTIESMRDFGELEGYDLVVMPDEGISRFLSSVCGRSWESVIFVQTFLRWDMPASLSEMGEIEDRSISVGELTKLGFFPFLEEARELTKRSSDWWRQVGAVLVKDGKQVLSAWNQHLPHELAPYFAGDPRSNFNAGEYFEISTAIHAEAAVIAAAARTESLSVEGSELFTTTFPCPGCANLIAVSRIGRLYFEEGYARADSKNILEEFDVEIIRVVE